MLNVKTVKLITGLFIISVLLSGCSLTFQSSGDAQSLTDGGMFRSIDSGSNWRQQTLIANVSGQPVTFNQTNVIALALDPQDRNAVYAGTDTGGLFYSYDAGASWTVAKTLGKRGITDIAVSTANKCMIYVASENRILRSNDCSRFWQEMYFDNDPRVRINALAVDPKDEKIVYAGTSRGELIMSEDFGQSWTTIRRFADSPRPADNSVIKVLINKNNPQNIWVATAGNGAYKTADRGKNWSSFYEQLTGISQRDAVTVTDMALAQSDGRTAIAATKAGLIRTADSGSHWNVMELVPPADKTAINLVAIHPADADRIYYATNTSFGSTEDGGKTWVSKKLPTTRAGVALAVDPANADIVYLGVYLIEKK